MKYLAYFNVAFFVLVASQRPKYREDYRYEKAFNAFYKVHHAAAVWADARIRCEAEGSVLMVPDSLDEADAMPLLVATILNKFEGVFIGIHDLYSERTFVTIRGNRVLGTILSLLWEQMEPRYGTGRCLAMRRTGRLFVHPCLTPLPYICKTKADGIIYNKKCDTFDPRWQVGPNGSCYFMQVEPQTWYQAYGTCLAAGGHLLVINDRVEANHVRDLFKQVADMRLPNNNFAFLGYSDLLQRHHYRTIHGQRLEETGYADWEFKCDRKGNITSTLRCGGLRRSGLLISGECDIPAMFFCEKPSSTINSTTDSTTARTTTSTSNPALRHITVQLRHQKHDNNLEITEKEDVFESIY